MAEIDKGVAEELAHDGLAFEVGLMEAGVDALESSEVFLVALGTDDNII